MTARPPAALLELIERPLQLTARERAALIEIPAYLKKGYTGLVNEFDDALCPNCRSDNFAVVDGHCDEVGCKP